MSLSRRHFNALAAEFAQARRTLVLTGATSTALMAFDQLVEATADQLASAAGTFDKARFFAAVRGTAPAKRPSTTPEESSHV